MYHVTHIFLGPSLGKVQMCQFSSLSDMRDRFFLGGGGGCLFGPSSMSIPKMAWFGWLWIEGGR